MKQGWFVGRPADSHLATGPGAGQFVAMDLNLRKIIRRAALGCLGLVVAVLVVGPLQEFVIALLAEQGAFSQPSARVAALMEVASEIAAAAWFHWIGGAIAGLAIGLWLDVLLRRADRRRTATRRAASALLIRARPYVQHITGRLKYAHEVCTGVRGAEHFYKKLVLQRIDMRNLFEADAGNLTELQREALEALRIEYSELDRMVTYGDNNLARLNEMHIAHLYRQRAHKLARSLNTLITTLSDGIPLSADLVPYELTLLDAEETQSLTAQDSDKSNAETSSEQYRLLLDFFVKHLQPIELTQRELRREILSAGVQNKRLRSLAMHGIEDNTFFRSVDDAALPLSMSPAVDPSLLQLINAIHNAEFSHQQSIDEVVDLVRSLDVKPTERLSQLWNNWRTKHAELIEAYEPIKRDPRLGPLFRPLREHKWGIIPLFEEVLN